jgi:hypothetical protein
VDALLEREVERAIAPYRNVLSAEALEDMADALREVLTINLDIPRAASKAIGALPGLVALRPRMVSEAPQFAIEKLDRLREYALGAWYAHILAMPPTSAGSPMQPLLEEAGPLREDLLVAAEALAHRGVLDAGAVAEIRGGTGHIDTATDLVALGTLFDRQWAKVSSKTAIEKQEVDRATVLGTEILTAMGARLQPDGEPVSTTEAADRRARAFTLFMKAYDACRKVVGFLRWDQGDAYRIAPSLFTKGRRARSVEEPPPAGPGAPVNGTPPVAGPGASGVSTSPVPIPEPA